MSTILPLANPWPTVSSHHRVARGARHGHLSAPRPFHPAEASRGHRVRSQQARKGFGAALPRLPSLGGKAKVPAGGVAPAPPVELGIPAEVERLGAEARDAWRRRCIEQPVVLPAHDARVHVVPVGADMPADAALIRDVVAAVCPDAIALESPPQHLKSYTAIAKALEPQLIQLLAVAAAADPLGPAAAAAAARSVFSPRQREELQAALLAACRGASLKPDPDQMTHMFRLGSLPFVEWLTPAHLVRTSAGGGGAAGGGARWPQPQQQAQPMLLVSCGLDREARSALPAASLFFGREFDLYLEEVEAALGEDAGGELAAWRSVLGDRLEAAGAGRELATLLAAWEAQACLGPEQQRGAAAAVEARLREERRAGAGEGEGGEGVLGMELVRTPADPVVARRLSELAAGKDVVRPCRRIVAVVGRVHALSVEEELRKIAAAGS